MSHFLYWQVQRLWDLCVGARPGDSWSRGSLVSASIAGDWMWSPEWHLMNWRRVSYQGQYLYTGAIVEGWAFEILIPLLAIASGLIGVPAKWRKHVREGELNLQVLVATEDESRGRGVLIIPGSWEKVDCGFLCELQSTILELLMMLMLWNWSWAEKVLRQLWDFLQQWWDSTSWYGCVSWGDEVLQDRFVKVTDADPPV